MIDATGRPGRVLLLGGTSEIGLAVLEAMALGPDTEVVLAGRDPVAMRRAAAHLSARVRTVGYDATRPATHRALVAEAAARGDLDVVVSAAGLLMSRPEVDLDGVQAAHLVDTNLTGHVSVLLEVAHHLRRQGHGTIVVLSSVAAVRPRRTTLVYGAAKAGLDAFAHGLADALAGTGVRVLVVRPGFVRGRMTEGLTPAPWSTTPRQVGEATAAALARSDRHGEVVWVPRGLAVVALAMRLAPRGVWRRLDL